MAMQSINGLNNNNKSYDLILDVGCGDGGITKLLAKHLRHKLVVGIDVVDDMISYARNHSTDDNNDNTIEYVLQDMDIDWLRMCPRIRQLESKVDLIFSNFVLEYMANKWLVMDTFGHLLATGGVFHANIFILPDLNKKLPENGQKKWWYQSREKQLDDWRQSLTDNQFLIKQFETIDVCWPTDRQKMIDYPQHHHSIPIQQKTCEYFKNGYVYRGPCKQSSYTYGSGSYHRKRPIHVNKHKHQQQHKQQQQHVDNDYSTPCTTVDGLAGLCRPPAYCFSQYDTIEQYLENQCKLNGQGLPPGICCPKEVVREPAVQLIPIRIPIPVEPVEPLDIDQQSVAEAADESRKIIKNQVAIERELIGAGFFQRTNTMESYHQAFFGPDDPEIQKIQLDGLVALETTLQLAKKYELTPQQARDGLQKYSLADTSQSSHCLKTPICDRLAKYRTYDGSCNNLRYPLWAKSLTQFIRLVPPAYADGLNELRVSVDGGPLPSPREVSCKLALDFDIPDRKFSLLVMQWGQIIDHDLTLTASTRATTGEGLHCCNEDATRQVRIKHPACKPIIIPRNDPFYSRHKHFCNNFVRNAAGPKYDCNLGYREQINTLTHIIDGSMVYGSTEERAKHLRSFKNGKLRVDKVNGYEFLPFDTQNRSDECAIPANLQRQRNYHCFVGGDVRVNEQTGLTMLHNVLLREHNRIATVLEELNPDWTDEIVYQESRRILAAEIQVITYNEWMPLIIGRRVMKEFNLLPKPDGYTYDYDDGLNPGIFNEFATAVYRFHTLIQGLLRLLNNAGKVTQTIQLRQHFNNPSSLYRKGAYDEFINGYTGNPTQTFDQFFTEDIVNHLFQEHDSKFGMDLIALNIQRGRDHGLPGYNDFREVCGMPRIDSFKHLDKVMRRGSAEIMASIYRHVDDIDLFIAGNHEKPLPDAVVGPTFACILAEQARRNKVGDRFWFENGKMKNSFTIAQLNELRKSSLAALVCDNSYHIEKMQTLAFLQPLDWNPRIDCSKITRVNLKLWKNEKIY
ncbi:peroxidase-like [Oppia nitens]|uniref:peroxidase-like n=1 Tax=Oppia nitens TaxID=1686743 RepID=UPI0023DC4F46|nr:peroxidase-like [Oppia nitens]